MREAHIAGTGIALPKPVSTARFIEVDQAVRRKLGQTEEIRQQILHFAENSRIERRHSSVQAWLADDLKDPGIEDDFTPFDLDPPAHVRARAWHRLAPPLAHHAARAAIADWGGSPSEITHVVTTSTSGWAEPGLSVSLIDELGLSEDTRKIELNFNGCFCGMTCLRTARDIVRGGESGAVLVMAAELATIQYNPRNTDPASLVASVLFADGAGAAIVAPEGKWRFEAAGMSLVPGSRDLLKMNPDFERESASYKMSLSPRVGSRLAAYFREGRGKALLDRFYGEGGNPATALAVHPGGPNILESVEGVLHARGWGRDVLDDSFATLRETGNLGAAAILFVLHRSLNGNADRVASLAFGPGVTVEWGQFARVSRL